MPKVFAQVVISLASFILSHVAHAVDLMSVDQSQPIFERIDNYCPWIAPENVVRLTVSDPEKIGWSGGSLSNAFGELFEKSGANLNYSNVGGNLPPNTQAVLFNTRYFNNNQRAEILVDELRLIDRGGNELSLRLDEAVRILSQNLSEAGEALLVCFTNDEDFVRISARLTHRNVDGSRPKVGIEALVEQEREEWVQLTP